MKIASSMEALGWDMRTGRPTKNIDRRQFESLCAIQCTEEEICAVLDASKSTILRWCKAEYGKTFDDVFDEKRKIGRASLRRKQFNLADKNATMAIWLGKQYLGQSDRPEDVIDTEDTEAYFDEAGMNGHE